MKKINTGRYGEAMDLSDEDYKVIFAGLDTITPEFPGKIFMDDFGKMHYVGKIIKIIHENLSWKFWSNSI